MTSELHTPSTLADLIEKELMGVDPDSQCVELDDTDWKLIVAALRRATPSADTLAGLVRYSWGECCMEANDKGWWVKHSEAAKIITAERAKKDELQLKLEERLSAEQFSHEQSGKSRDDWRKRAEATEAELDKHITARQSYADLFDGDVGSIHENIRRLKAELAQIKAQEPVATVEWRASNGRRVKSIYPINLDNVAAGSPLYAAPVSGSLKATSKQISDQLWCEMNSTDKVEALKGDSNDKG